MSFIFKKYIPKNYVFYFKFRVDLKDEMDTADLQRQSIMRKIEGTVDTNEKILT